MAELTEVQINEARKFIAKYGELNKKIDDISKMMSSLKTESDFIIKELEFIRAKEREWLKENAENLGIPEKDFINLLMNVR